MQVQFSVRDGRRTGLGTLDPGRFGQKLVLRRRGPKHDQVMPLVGEGQDIVPVGGGGQTLGSVVW